MDMFMILVLIIGYCNWKNTLQQSVFYNNHNFWLQCIKCKFFKCISINDQECKIKSGIINVNSNEPSFYPYSIKINKCSGSCQKLMKQDIYNGMKLVKANVD